MCEKEIIFKEVQYHFKEHQYYIDSLYYDPCSKVNLIILRLKLTTL